MRGVFSCTCPGDEWLAILEPPLSTGAGGGSPVYLAWQGGQITRASVWGPDAAKPQMDHRFGMARDLSERRGGPDAAEQGVLCAQQPAVLIARSSGAGPNALFLLPISSRHGLRG